MTESTAGEYKVDLDIYHGPLDLLLFLIKRDELDIYDIPIARITNSYVEYVNLLRDMKTKTGVDINLAGDFMVMAATLMEIKSATLLPRAPIDESNSSAAAELQDPRYELVQKLLEYKRFKDQSRLLQAKQFEHERKFPRMPAFRDSGGAENNEPPPLDLDEIQIWDLLDTFNRLMKEVGGRKRFHEVVQDDTPIELHAADIEDRLKREDKLSLRALIENRTSRGEMIGVFLALLELIREKKILVTQESATDDVEIIAAPPEHRATFMHAGIALSDEAAVTEERIETIEQAMEEE